jgi:DNA polymerase-3 subunit epsilon
MGALIFILIIIGVIVIIIKFTTSNDDTEVKTSIKTNNVPSKPNQNKMKEDYNDSIDIAQDILNDKEKYVILDTETTGLGQNDVIVQIGIIDLDGNVLLDTLIKPTLRKRMSPEATAVHGISMKMLNDQPTFLEIYPKFKEIIKGKKILIYNNAFDVRMIEQTCKQDEISLDGFSTLCLMKLNAVYQNEWNDYYGNYKWPKLPEGDHSSIGDCKATLKILNEISNGKKK